jgi:hypothetical protein
MPEGVFVYGETGDLLAVDGGGPMGNMVGCKFKVDNVNNVFSVRAKTFPFGTTDFGTVDGSWGVQLNRDMDQNGALTNCFSSPAVPLDNGVTPGHRPDPDRDEGDCGLNNFRFVLAVTVERNGNFSVPDAAEPVAIANFALVHAAGCPAFILPITSKRR